MDCAKKGKKQNALGTESCCCKQKQGKAHRIRTFRLDYIRTQAHMNTYISKKKREKRVEATVFSFYFVLTKNIMFFAVFVFRQKKVLVYYKM